MFRWDVMVVDDDVMAVDNADTADGADGGCDGGGR